MSALPRGAVTLANDARDAFSWLAAAVSIATFGPRGAALGTTLSSVVSLAVDPPALGFVARADGRLAEAIRGGAELGITVLGEAQRALAIACAEPRRAALEERALDRDFAAAPVLREGVVRFAVRPRHRLALGDRLFVIASIVAMEAPGGRPLLYHRRRYATLAPGGTP